MGPRISISAVFLVCLLLAWCLIGAKFTFTNDEGIYLEGARSVLDGKVLYRDHFAFTGPGCYWLTAASFWFFGSTIAASRVPLLLDLAAMTAAVYWLVAGIVSRRTAVAAAAVCFSILISNPSTQSVNHRWDSGALACIAATLAYSASRQNRRLTAISAGFCAAAAAWVTPSVLLAGAVLAIWLWRREQLTPFLIGGAACSLIAITILAVSGSLPHVIPSLLWASSHYSEANTVTYGSVNGGVARIFEGISPITAVVAAIVLIGVLAPAAAPLINLFGLRRLNPELRWLAGASFALVLSTYPRMDAGHLTNVFALPLVISAYLVSQLRFRRWIFAPVCISAGLLLFYAVQSRLATEKLSTNAGTVYAASRDVSGIDFAQRNVRPGQSLFVYPYMPVLYFLTGGVNPTPYSFLQPGMMSSEDERAALEHLKSSPPDFVLFCRPPLRDLLRIWPNTDPARVHMPALEGWIESNYQLVDPAQPHLLGYRLMQHRERKLESKLDPIPRP